MNYHPEFNGDINEIFAQSGVIPKHPYGSKITYLQFTGHRDDEHDVDIYEGDIIKITEDDSGEEYETTVRYEQGAFVVDVYGQDYDITALGWAIDLWDNNGDDWEVIGNIYENPEFLEKVL